MSELRQHQCDQMLEKEAQKFPQEATAAFIQK